MKSVNDWITVVREKVETLNFGVVQIVVHDSKVVAVERTEKIRFDGVQTRKSENSHGGKNMKC